MPDKAKAITKFILKAAKEAKKGVKAEPEPELTGPVKWPLQCTVGPGLEGAIACESKVGYVNGTKGWLIYRGYNIFDLSAYSTFEEVSYLLLHGRLPTAAQLSRFKRRLVGYRLLPDTLRMLMGFPVEVLTGQLEGGELLAGFACQVGWLSVAVLLYALVWRRGLRHYTAVGG